MTSNRVDLIEPENFIQQVLEESVSAYVFHIIMIESCPSQIQCSQMAQISAAISETIILSEEYKVLEDVFSSENADHLSLY